jgi:hypothetical protein
MDVPAVTDIAKTFSDVSDTLRAVEKALDAIANMLKAAAMMGLIGAAVMERFVDIWKRQIDEMADKTAEISKDVFVAIDAYQRGDQAGATRFH